MRREEMNEVFDLDIAFDINDVIHQSLSSNLLLIYSKEYVSEEATINPSQTANSQW